MRSAMCCTTPRSWETMTDRHTRVQPSRMASEGSRGSGLLRPRRWRSSARRRATTLRPVHDGAGDGRALRLPAGQVDGVPCGDTPPGRGPTISQHCVPRAPRGDLTVAHARDGACATARSTDRADAPARVERGERGPGTPGRSVTRSLRRTAAPRFPVVWPRVFAIPPESADPKSEQHAGQRRSCPIRKPPIIGEALPRAHVHVHAEQHLPALPLRADSICTEAAAAAARCHSLPSSVRMVAASLNVIPLGLRARGSPGRPSLLPALVAHAAG